MSIASLRTIEHRLWRLCKEVVRKVYASDNCYICDTPFSSNKDKHTGHLFKKNTLPYQFKYSLRVLRPCCTRCNLFKNGNESWYMVKILENEGENYILQLVNEIRNSKDTKSVPVLRKFMLELEEEYVKLLTPYQGT